MPVTVNGTAGITFNDNTTQATSPFTGGFAMRNRIINGDMRIDQRNNGAAIASLGAGTTYTVDRFAYYGGITAKFSAQRNAGSVTPPAGFTNYLGFTSLAATTPSTASDIYQLYHMVEGLNVADLGWGTSNAQPITLAFWARSSITGTHSGVMTNSAQTRTYGFTYTINAANTWEFKTIIIPGDTSGTWLTNNGVGIQVVWNLGVAATYQSSGGTWSSSTFYAVTGSVNVCATNGATFYITGVQLEKGSTATSFDYRPYGTELQLCQRYYEEVLAATRFQGTAAVSEGCVVNFSVSKRATPTLAVKTVLNNTNASAAFLGDFVSTAGFSVFATAGTSTLVQYAVTASAASEL